MAKITFQIKGARELQRAIAKRPMMMATQTKTIVAKHGALLNTKTAQNMAVTYLSKEQGGYSTGATKGSLSITFSNAGMTVAVAPHTEYFSYLEFGTRFMSARPTLKPAFAYQSVQFVNDLRKMMK
ncbi:HK97-gp10 family putative phage morphogenesis protein [Limosilactobacillus mucosae]|uniref:HK97-gp10 family putative phage morphogenesis protein n=1 Tax=Limosilactobacillus mucosae TaxID=97478 RepID=UPI00233E9E90|nr:HK97-gp10 family putative phage morphogenesis protein [Limosilactobacillus mucosae]MDC2841604.1 hypothetical protein [Limosilactobacillus mucosae]